MSEERDLLNGVRTPSMIDSARRAMTPQAMVPAAPQGVPLAESDGVFWFGLVGVTEVGLRFDPDAGEDDWRAFQTAAKKLQGISTWLWCDYYAFGADVLKKSYADMAAAVGRHKPSTVESYASIGRGIGGFIRLNFRSTTLKLNHFAQVLALPSDQQAAWLQKALDNGWSKRELKAAIENKPLPKPRKKRSSSVTLAQARAGVQKLAAAVKPDARRELAAHLRQLANELEGAGDPIGLF